MTFEQLDDLISKIYKYAYLEDADRADDLIENLADALYENRIGSMIMILEEWDAQRWLKPSFYTELEQAIYAYMDGNNAYLS